MTSVKLLLCAFLVAAAAACSAGEEAKSEYYPDGTLKAVWTLRGGKRDGALKQFYEDGRLQLVGQYKDGMQNGLTKMFDPEGRLKAEATYKNDTLDGPSRIYYPSGKIKFEGVYSEGRLFSGREFDETGKLKSGLVRKDGFTESLSDAVPGSAALNKTAPPDAK